MRKWAYRMLGALASLTSLAVANQFLRDLPADSWYRAPNTKMRAVCPSDSQYPEIRGSTGCATVMDGWGGGAYDSAGKRLWVWGGGHGNYYGNEIYAFDLEKLAWSRVTDPSPVTTLSADPLPDGNPISRHTYDGLAFITHANRFFGYGGSMAGDGYGTEVTWTFDPVAKQWHNMAPAGSGNSPTTACCNFNGEYDPATRKIFMRDPNWLCAYDYDKNEWTHVRAWDHTWGPGKGVIDGKRHLLFTIGSQEFLVYDIAADKDISAAWKTTGGDSLINGYGVGAAFDSRADHLMGWIGGGVFMLDMDSKVWTRMSAVGAPVNQIAQGTFGRFRYDSDDGVFILANGVDEDMYFYKPPSGAGAAVKAVTGSRPRLRPTVEWVGNRIRFRRPQASAESKGRDTWNAAGRKESFHD